MKPLIPLLAALSIICAAQLSFAETVLIEPFALESDEVPMPCDVEKVISDELAKIGCDILTPGNYSSPDIIVTGKLWVSGENTFAAVNVADTVNRQLIGSHNLFLPRDEGQCRDLARKVAEEVGDPPLYARRLNFLDNGTGMEFVYIPGGSFRMGSDEGPGNWVTVESYFMARHEVTQAQWIKVMGSNPSVFTGDPNLPVENISWYDAGEFVRRLNEKTGRKYRLPTEVEWEYAARTRGRTFKWAGTSATDKLGNFAWTRENSELATHPVGQKRANGLGLFDMSGNVWEWTSDRYVSKGNQEKMGEASDRKVIRGGSWMMEEGFSRTCAREASSAESRYHDNGMRLVLEVVPAAATPLNAVAASSAPKINQ